MKRHRHALAIIAFLASCVSFLLVVIPAGGDGDGDDDVDIDDKTILLNNWTW